MLISGHEGAIKGLASHLVEFIGKTLFVFAGTVVPLTQLSAAGWPEFPVPEESKVVVVGDDLNINGLPTRIWELSSTKRPEEILEYYRQTWQKPAEPAGPGFIEKEAAGWKIISRADGPYLYTVQVMEADMRSTFGFLAVSQPLELKNHQPAHFDVPAGGEILLDLASDDSGKLGRVVQFKNSQSIAANYRFYRQRYIAKGWEELSELPVDGTKALLLMNKGAGKVSVVFNRVGNESYGVLVESYD